LDYFNDVFNNLSGPASFNPLESYGGVIQLSDFITNILICIANMNKSLMGLEQHEDE